VLNERQQEFEREPAELYGHAISQDAPLTSIDDQIGECVSLRRRDGRAAGLHGS
jgi:hypothetical protein